MQKIQIAEHSAEPPVEACEAGERERKEYTEAGGDYAAVIVKFLRGRRHLSIQPSEIIATRLYAKSNAVEQNALRLVCESEYPEVPPSPDDAVRLKMRDHFICEYAYTKTLPLGNAAVIKAIVDLPRKVAEKQQWDSTFFSTIYDAPSGIFEWIWR